MRPVEAIENGDKCRSAVQQRKGIFHPVRPDRHFMAIDPVGKPDFSRAARVDSPAVLARFRKRQGLAGRIGNRNGFDVSSILADEVRSWSPDRHENLDFGSISRRQAGFHRRIMPPGIGEPDGVPYWWMKPGGLVVFNHERNAL